MTLIMPPDPYTFLSKCCYYGELIDQHSVNIGEMYISNDGTVLISNRMFIC